MTPELKEKTLEAIRFVERTAKALRANIETDLTVLYPQEEQSIMMNGIRNHLGASMLLGLIFAEHMSQLIGGDRESNRP